MCNGGKDILLWSQRLLFEPLIVMHSHMVFCYDFYMDYNSKHVSLCNENIWDAKLHSRVLLVNQDDSLKLLQPISHQVDFIYFYFFEF